MTARRLRMVAAALLLLWVATGAALSAPAGEGDAPAAPDASYTLTWWTVDGGGISYGSAGAYTLGGTAGQADAAGLLAGAAYSLRPGFWQSSCAAALVAVGIARAGNSVTLSWTHAAPNQAYEVHRGTTPYFAPSLSTRRALVTVEPWSYTDPDAVVGDPNVNYYYLVRPTCAAAYVDAGRRGEFDFVLIRDG